MKTIMIGIMPRARVLAIGKGEYKSKPGTGGRKLRPVVKAEEFGILTAA